LKLIKLEDAEAEMKIALSISIPFTDVVLVEAGVVLNESTTLTLKSMGITEITVYEESELREMLRQAEENADPSKKARKVLVVDDEKEICNYIGEVLNGAGFKPITALGAAEAWNKLATDPSINDMFLDLMMPETNGLEFLGKVRNELGRNINVVIITAKKTMEEVVIAKKLGIIDYITKPFTPERILKPLQAAAPESKTQQAGTAGN
jgi:CheY-like chemotaxis protein